MNRRIGDADRIDPPNKIQTVPGLDDSQEPAWISGNFTRSAGVVRTFPHGWASPIPQCPLRTPGKWFLPEISGEPPTVPAPLNICTQTVTEALTYR